MNGMDHGTNRATFAFMCSHYEAAFKDLLRGWKIPFNEWKNYGDVYREWRKTNEAMGNLRVAVEPTKNGLVIKCDGTVSVMKWGFMRRRPRVDGKGMKAAAPTVNAQSEKVHNGHSMWSESWKAGRRCLIPVSAFYEWTGPTGDKVTHRFHMDGRPFGIAGLWEDSEEFGECFTMLTTIPNKEVGATGHDRCLVALKDEEEASRWMAGEDFKRDDFLRPDGMFLVESGVPNPRASKTPKKVAKKKTEKSKEPPAQGELFGLQ